MTGRDWKHTVPLPGAVRLTWHAAEAFPREIPLHELYASLGFPAAPGPLPYLVANMVMTQNGEATVGGKAVTIGTSVDAFVLTRLRSAVDAVLVGSGTLVRDDVTAVLPEAEVARRQARGSSPRLLVVVVASTLAWDAGIFARRFFTDPRFDKLVLAGGRAGEAEIRAVGSRGIEVVQVPSGPDGRPGIDAVLGILAARGVGSAVCEGGPRFLPSLFGARALREYFLTTSPMITGEPGVPRPVQGAVTVQSGPVLLSRISRYEHDFHDPQTHVRLVEAFDRFQVVYPPATALRPPPFESR
jgi:riboflavin biosynthesis pyrimidine reductase